MRPEVTAQNPTPGCIRVDRELPGIPMRAVVDTGSRMIVWGLNADERALLSRFAGHLRPGPSGYSVVERAIPGIPARSVVDPATGLACRAIEDADWTVLQTLGVLKPALTVESGGNKRPRGRKPKAPKLEAVR